MDSQLKDKLALVTASTGGIGLAIAKNLAEEGASVIVNGRSQESVDRAIAQIASNTKVTSLVADLSSTDGVERALAQYSQLDILINNLGIYEAKPFLEITDEDWQEMFNINVMSGIRLCRAYFPQMLEQNWGRIIFISSDSGVQIPLLNLYDAVPQHIHAGGDTFLYVLSGRGKFQIGDREPIEVGAGTMLYWAAGVSHGMPEMIEEPVTMLAFDAPFRDPDDIIYTNPAEAPDFLYR